MLGTTNSVPTVEGEAEVELRPGTQSGDELVMRGRGFPRWPGVAAAISAGYGTTADAFRITDTHPEGRGAITCMKMALRDAGKNPADIDYINAHGTSTQVNDRVESLAIKEAFGTDVAYKVPVSSTKSMTGHLIAAAGARS